MFTSYTYLADILDELAGLNGATVGWILMGFGGVGLFGNWAGGRLVDRHPLGASALFCLSLAIGLIALVPVIKESLVLALVLVVLGICQAALFTVSHTRVMKAAEDRPALGASLNISGCNIGIALGAFIGSRSFPVSECRLCRRGDHCRGDGRYLSPRAPSHSSAPPVTTLVEFIRIKQQNCKLEKT
jgi:DHA1 family inner membrane transport protein